jgi:hypothetical protein
MDVHRACDVLQIREVETTALRVTSVPLVIVA